MPMYDYECEECGHSDTEFMRMKDDNVPLPCPHCGAENAYKRQISLPHTDMKEFYSPTVMHSMGCDNDQQIRELKEACPDIHVETDKNHPLYGVPQAANRKQKLAVLEACGFQEGS